MGKLNGYLIKANETLQKLEVLRNTTGGTLTAVNKTQYDYLTRRLAHYRLAIKVYGRDYPIQRVTLMTKEFMYFSGISQEETKDLLSLERLDFVEVTTIMPGIKIKIQ